MKAEVLNIMKVRSMMDEWSSGIWAGENMFTGLEVFETCPRKIKRMVLQLTHMVVYMPMKCVHPWNAFTMSCPFAALAVCAIELTAKVAERLHPISLPIAWLLPCTPISLLIVAKGYLALWKHSQQQWALCYVQTRTALRCTAFPHRSI